MRFNSCFFLSLLVGLLWCVVDVPRLSVADEDGLNKQRPTASPSSHDVSTEVPSESLATGIPSEPSTTLEAWERRLLRKYGNVLEPLLNDALAGCVDCHQSEVMSNLILSGNALQDLRNLMDNGYLSLEGPDTLLGRVTTENEDRRMPKDGPAWSRKQIRKLKRFLEACRESLDNGIGRPDERFPRSLMAAYSAPESARAPTQMLSYRQLKSKIWSIFQDDWVRGDRDQFAENVGAFGGADFATRFNESKEATASYLTALETLSRDVASRAYQQRTGPFREWPDDLAPMRDRIGLLYHRVLYRPPTETELRHAQELMDQIRGLRESIALRDTELKFEVTCIDPTTGTEAAQIIDLPVRGDRESVRQFRLNQAKSEREKDLWDVVQDVTMPMLQRLANRLAPPTDATRSSQSLGTISLGPAASGRVLLHNRGTRRNVSFRRLDVISRDDGRLVQSFEPSSPEVRMEGAWTEKQNDGFVSFEDGNQHKGLSTVTVDLSAEEAGDYEVIVHWRVAPGNAENVLVELHGQMPTSELESFAPIEAESKDFGRFHYDCGNDSVPYVELPGTYQFDSDGYVEITNQGTHQRVTAGAIEWINASDPTNHFLIDSKEADGSEDWSEYKEGTFRAYNVRGSKLHDENGRKGELRLRYRLSQAKEGEWRPEAHYRVRVYYPGKRDHEPLVPVTVVAKQSTPIVHVRCPRIAKADTNVRIDASPSYTVHGSQLEFHWRQVAGPSVHVKDWNSPVISFVAPRQDDQEMAWVSLCAALIRHPDFLFTRPLVNQAEDRESLDHAHLAKISMDLLGRPPTEKEFSRLGSGEDLSELVDFYLSTSDFRDFYFHRVRLYLESQGTELQDEPARLWSYIAFEDRPFQEILTADYTVDSSFQKTDRPAHHGRTGVLTMPGFIAGKPGLPHYNYAAQVAMLFLGYVFEVPPEIVEQREGVTALGTTDPNSNCYSCHKILTPLAFQRLRWTDEGQYRLTDSDGMEIDASDRDAVPEYPFKGEGLEAFAVQAVKKERFIRTMINTHVHFYFGRSMRHRKEERHLYKRLWDNVHENGFQLRSLIKAIVTSPEYLHGSADADLRLSNRYHPGGLNERTFQTPLGISFQPQVEQTDG